MISLASSTNESRVWGMLRGARLKISCTWFCFRCLWDLRYWLGGDLWQCYIVSLFQEKTRGHSKCWSWGEKYTQIIFCWQAANVFTSCDTSFRIQGIIHHWDSKSWLMSPTGPNSRPHQTWFRSCSRGTGGPWRRPGFSQLYDCMRLCSDPGSGPEKRLLKIPRNETKNRELRAKNFELSMVSGWSDSPVSTQGRS